MSILGDRLEIAWPHPLTAPNGQPLGTVTLMRHDAGLHA
jgi:hypothetical protein